MHAMPTLGGLDQDDAPPGLGRQIENLKWNRPGQWHEVTVNAETGGEETLLVARDRFGDRIIAARADGHAIWSGEITCPEGIAKMAPGVMRRRTGDGATRAGPYLQRHAEPDLCGRNGARRTGAPMDVWRNARASRHVSIRVTDEMLRQMDADAAAGRPVRMPAH